MCMHSRGSFFEKVKSSGIPIYIFSYTTIMKPYTKGLLNCFRISRKFKEIKPDIIHSFHYSADYSEALAARLAGIKWVYTKKNMSWGGSSANAWKLRSRLANAIIVQNTDMLRLYFPHSKKVSLIPRGVNITDFEFDPHLPDLRSNYGITKDENIIITVANLVPVKGIELLIEAFNLLVNDNPDWYLIIVGDDSNDYANKIKLLCEELRIHEKIIFTGKVSDVKSHLQMAKIFVLPTLNKGREEGFPVSLLEAMVNGRYVIGSAVSGIRDQLRYFPNNLFTPGDYKDLYNRLITFISLSKNEQEQLIFSISKYAIEQFRIENEINQHSYLYNMLLRGGSIIV